MTQDDLNPLRKRNALLLPVLSEFVQDGSRQSHLTGRAGQILPGEEPRGEDHAKVSHGLGKSRLGLLPIPLEDKKTARRGFPNKNRRITRTTESP